MSELPTQEISLDGIKYGPGFEYLKNFMSVENATSHNWLTAIYLEVQNLRPKLISEEELYTEAKTKFRFNINLEPHENGCDNIANYLFSNPEIKPSERNKEYGRKIYYINTKFNRREMLTPCEQNLYHSSEYSLYIRLNLERLRAANALFFNYKRHQVRKSGNSKIDNAISYTNKSKNVDPKIKDYMQKALLISSLMNIIELIATAQSTLDLLIANKMDYNSVNLVVKFLHKFSYTSGISQIFNGKTYEIAIRNRNKILEFVGFYNEVIDSATLQKNKEK